MKHQTLKLGKTKVAKSIVEIGKIKRCYTFSVDITTPDGERYKGYVVRMKRRKKNEDDKTD